jgi:basic membrane lipoprotein Med (substrate-binding protein (PBP1-ABC) superfamily)
MPPRLMINPRRTFPAFSTAAHIALCIVLLACRSNERPTPAQAGGFRVALLTPSPISDQAWNAGAYQGLLRIRDSLGAQISHIQTKSPADFEENFRQYGAQGYDLVFGHGFEFQDAASRVGPDFPHTVFITTSGNRVRANVAPIVFGFEEPSYLAGVLAGSISKSGLIGAIGGTELPPVRSSFLAFEAGVHSVNPRATVLTSYVGSWEDASTAKEQALALIHRGVDIIFQNADAAGLGIFQAARDAKGVYVFGANANQNDVAPDVIIASVVIDVPHAFLLVARSVKDKTFHAQVLRLGEQEKVVELVMNPKLASAIPPAARAAVDSARAAIASGRVHPPHLEFVDTTVAH